jgi:hypothetical protein
MMMMMLGGIRMDDGGCGGGGLNHKWKTGTRADAAPLRSGPLAS